MVALVVDCSISVSWVLPDENSESVQASLDLVAERGAIAPVIWPLEFINTLLVAEKRGRISKKERERILALIHRLPIEIDKYTPIHAWQQTLELAETHGLTAYDAAYLELAIRLSLPIASLDKQLLRAAEACGVKRLP
jgi:predicted nucleic acid-binding protein